MTADAPTSPPAEVEITPHRLRELLRDQHPALAEGEAADLAPPDASEAPVLAQFLRAVHQPAPATAPKKSGA